MTSLNVTRFIYHSLFNYLGTVLLRKRDLVHMFFVNLVQAVVTSGTFAVVWTAVEMSRETQIFQSSGS